MSVRKQVSAQAPHVAQLQKELGDLKATAVAANEADSLAASGTEASANAASYESLSKTEQSCAQLGVHPDAWKPIGFMNNAHYDQLMKSNKLDSDLARRIESYKVVASS